MPSFNLKRRMLLTSVLSHHWSKKFQKIQQLSTTAFSDSSNPEDKRLQQYIILVGNLVSSTLYECFTKKLWVIISHYTHQHAWTALANCRRLGEYCPLHYRSRADLVQRLLV